MRTLALVLALAASLAAPAAAEDGDVPTGWTVARKTLEGSERRPWYLALVFHKTPKVVTMVVAPASTAGHEGAGVDVERIERSAIGDIHQIARWADRLNAEAKGWKRPSLRERPPASPHVIGVVRSVHGEVRVENAEHGGGDLAVGDFLFVEDVLSGADDATFEIELIGPENPWHYRALLAELRAAAGAQVGLRGTSDALRVHLHRGAVEAATRDHSLTLQTRSAEYVVGPEARVLVTPGRADRLDLREGTVQASRDGAKSTVVGGSTLVLEPDDTQRVLPLDETAWRAQCPPAPPCGREEALRLADRLTGTWRGEPLSSTLRLGDDGQWTSYERQPGRSIKKGGSWEPLPGGLVQLTHVWTPHRATTPKTDHYRYVLDGSVLRRLVPGGPVFLKE